MKKVTKGEKLLYIGGVFCMVSIVLLKIFFGTGISNYKMSNENLRNQINSETKNVESLAMQFNELTSYDNLKDIVKELGLAYNNDNIIVVGD